MFAAWRGARPGGDGDGERAAAIAAVRRFLTAHGESRFEEIGGDAARPVVNRAGWRRRDDGGTVYWIAPDVWRGEVCAGLDADAAAKALRAAGFLHGDDGRLTRKVRLPGVPTPARVFAVAGAILAGGDAAGEDPEPTPF
jgi:uncharacterized protein (DUF927 family)